MTIAEIRPKRAKEARRLRMSEAEFVAWCDDDTHAEWVDGEVVMMSPVNSTHSDVTGFLNAVLRQFVEEHQSGSVLAEPFQVRLPRQRRRRSPDLLFVIAARAAIVEEQQVNGAPDLIMEVVSPGSVDLDWREKHQEYEKAGVREYWVIDPANRRVVAYTLDRKRYREVEEKEGRIYSTVLKGFFLKPTWLWPTRPPVRKALREMGIK